MPGNQLLDRLEKLQYRVKSIADAALLVETATRETPLVVFVDVLPRTAEMTQAINALRNAPATRHLPIIAFGAAVNSDVEKEARVAGANVVANDKAVLMHLGPLLDQALALE
jgi:CheY-like chemotaxis protein